MGSQDNHYSNFFPFSLLSNFSHLSVQYYDIVELVLILYVHEIFTTKLSKKKINHFLLSLGAEQSFKKVNI